MNQPYPPPRQQPGWPAQPQQHYGYPPQHPYPYPQPGYHYPAPPQPGRKPLHHWFTWPAVAAGVLAQIIADTARVIDYQTVIMFSILGLAISIPAVVLAIRARHGWCIFFAVGAVLNSLWAIGIGYSAFEQYQEIVDQVRSAFGS